MSLLRKIQHKKAIAYYRHSAEDKQENSVPLQREFVRDFLSKNDVELIHEEADEGVSGLTASRPAFQRLLKNWIFNPAVESFDYVVFYDVSRMGRFEDTDEAGHYEYECRRAGKEVIYARRGFTPEYMKGASKVQTGIERWASFEYSKKLSEDVIRGCLNISRQGYSVGGVAPYGMSRMLLSSDGRSPIRVMKRGEHKSVANERIIFVPTEDAATETVKKIFAYFLNDANDLTEIACRLNNEGATSSSGGNWNVGKVHRILKNPAYKGTLVYNKTWGRLKRKKRRNPVADWVVRHNAFPALIDPERFDTAQKQLYWLLPSNYLKGFFMIRKTKKDVYFEIESIFKKNNIDPDTAQTVPVTLAVKRYFSDRTPFWCFMIPRKLERNTEILCLALSDDADESIDKRLVIPAKLFNLQGMYLVCGLDQSQLVRSADDIESTLLSFASLASI